MRKPHFTVFPTSIKRQLNVPWAKIYIWAPIYLTRVLNSTMSISIQIIQYSNIHLIHKQMQTFQSRLSVIAVIELLCHSSIIGFLVAFLISCFVITKQTNTKIQLCLKVTYWNHNMLKCKNVIIVTNSTTAPRNIHTIAFSTHGTNLQ